MTVGLIKLPTSVPHLTEESDWLLAHGMRITNVGFDDLGERVFHSLEKQEKRII